MHELGRVQLCCTFTRIFRNEDVTTGDGFLGAGWQYKAKAANHELLVSYFDIFNSSSVLFNHIIYCIHICVCFFFLIVGICPVLCSGHGVYGGGVCHCDEGWKGQECDTPDNECVDPQCGGRGTCVRGECKCQPGWTGENCEEGQCTGLSPNFVCLPSYDFTD